MKKKWMKKLVCLAAAVMMIGSVSAGTQGFTSGLPLLRNPKALTFFTLTSDSTNVSVTLNDPLGVPIYIGFYKGDWNRVVTEQRWETGRRSGSFMYQPSQKKGTTITAYAGCQYAVDTTIISGAVHF